MTNTPPFPDKKYSVILADPPWKFANWTSKKNGASSSWYDCLSIDQLRMLPVKGICDDNCALLLWVTGPKLAEGVHLPVMWAWGFRPVTMLFTWNKTSKNGNPYCGLGFYSRSGSEHCMLGVRGSVDEELSWWQDADSTDYCMLGLKGKLKRESASVRQVITAPRRVHSQKPDEQYERIEQLFGDVPRIELFARGVTRPGWDTWGFEAGKSMEDIKRRTNEGTQPVQQENTVS